MNRNTISAVSPLIVTYQGHPVKFVQNLQRVFTVCHIDDATMFESEGEARVKLRDWNLHGNGRFAVRRKILEQ